MSNSEKVPASRAWNIVNELMTELETMCLQVSVAGSLRRNKPMVGDVEIVAMPMNPGQFLARLDKWVFTGKVGKAVYSNGTNRWGDKYRGINYKQLRIEIFLADVHNWGYIEWLRTGPGDANQFVMQQMNWGNSAPFGFDGGYLREKPYMAKRRDGVPPISIPTEAELFRLLGMPFIAPEQRTLETYSKYAPFQYPANWTLAEITTEPKSLQQSLF